MPKSPTATLTPRLSDLARHVVFPSDIATTVWPRVEAKCAEMGVKFDPWQQGVGSIALGKRKDGKYAATVGGIVLSIPRQVGKTFLVGMILIALCVLFPGLTVLWTAHRTRTATKTFQTLQGMVRRKKIRPHLAPTRTEGIRTANGEQEIRFRNGSVIMFGAREQGFGRGFDEVDVEVFDEAQILSEKALEDMVPAANQSQHEAGALLFFMGTPPRPTDPGEEFTNRRTRALSGKATNMVYVEFSADEGADPDDRKQWSKANPSFPARTPVESMERMREQLTDVDSFRREALGIWDADDASSLVAEPLWLSLIDASSEVASHRKWALDVSPDRKWASFGGAGRRADGRPHIECIDRRPNTAWVKAEAVRRFAEIKIPLRILAGSPAAAFIAPLTELGVEIEEVPLTEHGAALGQFLDAAHAGDLRHLGQASLGSAVKNAVVRTSGETDVLTRRKSLGDITPLVSVVVALGGVPAPSDPEFFVY